MSAWVTSVNLVEIRGVGAGSLELASRGVFRLLVASVARDGALNCAALRSAGVKPCAFVAPLRGCGA
jgi:hypothetical protein